MSSDSEAEVKKEKKSKKNKRQRTSSSSSEEVIDKTPVKKTKPGSSSGNIKNADGEEMMEIGRDRYVTVRNFKGKELIDIREYYKDKGSGVLRPGKKGISLSLEQFKTLKTLLPEIDKKLQG